MNFSVLIRNKNKHNQIERLLQILSTFYNDYVNQIVLVDNLSDESCIEIYKKYNVEIVTIENFSYGGAINLGMSRVKNEWVFLISSHCIPLGIGFLMKFCIY
jgi:glycosyltransferase involved in cell wall biosynthesis